MLALNVMSAAECERIVALAERQAWRTAYSSGYREGHISGAQAAIPEGEETDWIGARLELVFSRANAHYRFAAFESWDVRRDWTFYRYAEGDHFDWHIDNVARDGGVRKLAITLQLSDPQSYEGGDLDFQPGGVMPLSRTRGAAVVFPAFLCHRVGRVTRGVRHSLATGLFGPAFR